MNPPNLSVIRAGDRPREMPEFGILGTGSALPRRAVSNEELSKFLDTSDEWIAERVGVRLRYIADADESTAQLGALAGERALEASGLEASDIDLLVVATVTPDQPLPSTASLIQRRLGISRAMALDVNAACSGFLFGLATAAGLQKIGNFRNALVIGTETLSRTLDWTDRQTCVLFGDGAGAVVLRSAPTTPILGVDLHTDGTKGELICRPGPAFPVVTIPESIVSQPPREASPFVQMQGREVFKLAVNAMVDSIRNVLESSETELSEVALFVPHQSNRRIVEAVYRQLGLEDLSRVVLNIDRVANTSSASIPIALDEAARAGRLKRGDLVMLSAVGAGFTWGSILIRW